MKSLPLKSRVWSVAYCECIRKTIADVQRRAVPALAEAAESANRELGMLERDGHDFRAGQRKKSLELRTPRIALSAFDDAGHFHTCNG